MKQQQSVMTFNVDWVMPMFEKIYRENQHNLHTIAAAAGVVVLVLLYTIYRCCFARSSGYYKFSTKELLKWLVERNPKCVFALVNDKDGFIEHDLKHFQTHLRTVVKANLSRNQKKALDEETAKRNAASKQIVLRFLAIALPADISISLTYEKLASNSTWAEAIRHGKQKTQAQELEEYKKHHKQQERDAVKRATLDEFFKTDLYKVYYIDYQYLTRIPAYLHDSITTQLDSTHLCCLCANGYRSNWPQAHGKTIYHRTLTAFRNLEGQYQAFSLCNLHTQQWGHILRTEAHGDEDLKAYYVS